MPIRSILGKRLSTAGSIMLVICGVSVTSAFAQCSNETFQGDYGFSVNGVILPFSGGQLTIQGVQLIHSDGHGKLTDHETMSINGVLKHGVVDPNFPGSTGDQFGVNAGTYTLNQNCTGQAHLTDTNGADISLNIVVDRDGNQVRMTSIPPFLDNNGAPRCVSSVGERVSPPKKN